MHHNHPKLETKKYMYVKMQDKIQNVANVVINIHIVIKYQSE